MIDTKKGLNVMPSADPYLFTFCTWGYYVYRGRNVFNLDGKRLCRRKQEKTQKNWRSKLQC